MTAISNFTQAMKELTGFDEESAKAETKKSKTEIKQEQPAIEEEKKEEIKLSKKADIGVPVFDEEEGSFVTSTMIITGNVISSDQIKVDGKVSGDLRTTQATMVNGTISGNIDSCNLIVNGAVKGDLKVEADTDVAAAAVIVGDIASKNLRLKGKVKGNLKIAGTTGISETAILSGDIDTNDLYTEKGCVIHGTITTKDTANFNFEEEKLFDIGE